ncbi:MAG: serine/threonine protein kinase [Phycisphaerales bacterium]|nr:serine/threonine protein kinase [Phycisphaerales bacterium]
MPMTPERFQRVRVLFESGKCRTGKERDQFLERECADDAELLDEVRSLLESDEQVGTFLGTPAAEVNEAVLEALRLDVSEMEEANPPMTAVGARVGHYRITSFIAEGAMGRVYEAEQEQPKRTVALKVLSRPLATRTALRRFQDEAQILARLRHPNIAQVFEAGTHTDGSDPGGGVLFFAMELVPGARSITEYAEVQRLSIRDRLGLFCKVCEAVHHGHQKGIIHRDLKPANILVDSTGEPKVIDFGVARITDSDISSTTQETEIGQIVGTLQYMSPEQCDGDPHELDSRCDVYSLGAILYELLSRTPALDIRGTPLHQATRLIREGPTRSLASLDRRFRGDLEAIVSTAMQKNRDRRYQSAEALRTDIVRHLAGEAIDARPVSKWIRITRWLGKHPFPVSIGASGAVAVIVLATSAGLTWYNNHRPFEFWISPDGRFAHLITKFNRPLDTLGGNAAEPYNVHAKLVSRPGGVGGGRFALFTVREGAHATGQQLWVCDVNDLAAPLWRTEAAEPHSHPSVPEAFDRVGEPPSYVVNNFFVANVLPDSPEDEIVVIHEQNSSSPNAIRVYDFAGNVLFEAWHFGHVSRVAWWSTEQLLICSADRHGKPDIERYGYANPPPYPRVVFAIRPQRNLAANAWLNERDWPESWRSKADLSTVLVWYKSLSTRSWSSILGPGPIRSGRNSRASSIEVGFETGVSGPGLVLFLDPLGRVMGSDSNDLFNQRRADFPPDAPTLVDWPPLGN